MQERSRLFEKYLMFWRSPGRDRKELLSESRRRVFVMLSAFVCVLFFSYALAAGAFVPGHDSKIAECADALVSLGTYRTELDHTIEYYELYTRSRGTASRYELALHAEEFGKSTQSLDFGCLLSADRVSLLRSAHGKILAGLQSALDAGQNTTADLGIMLNEQRENAARTEGEIGQELRASLQQRSDQAKKGRFWMLFLGLLISSAGLFALIAIISRILSQHENAHKTALELLSHYEPNEAQGQIEPLEAARRLGSVIRKREISLQNMAVEIDKRLVHENKGLRKKVEQLERFQEMATDREIKMVELKKRLKECEKETG